MGVQQQEIARSRVVPAKTGLLSPARKEAMIGWIFAAPWIIGFLVFTAGPMLYSFYTSFTDYNIIRAPEWVGLRNYETLFTRDPNFYKSLYNTIWMVVVRTPLVVLVSMAIAILLNMDLPGERFFRSTIYLPNVLSGIAAIFLWKWILAPNGLFNRGLDVIGLNGPGWFVDPQWTKPGLTIMGLWWVGGNVLIFLAGLKGIPRSLYEAASIDGAGDWAKIWNVTLPLLTPTIFFEVITGLIGAFQIFSTAYILAGADASFGGPGGSMLFYVLHLYNRAFGRSGSGGFQMGYASAMAWILFAIILLITFIQLRLANRWVHYEAGD